MFSGIRASDPRGLNKGGGSKFRVGSQVRQETPEEGHIDRNNKDEDNSLKTLKDKKVTDDYIIVRRPLYSEIIIQIILVK